MPFKKDEWPKIAPHLKRIRLSFGLSLRGAGRLTGVSASQIRKYETGFVEPRAVNFIRLMDAYGIEREELISWLGEKK